LTRCLARVRWQLAPVCCPGFGHLQWMYCSLGHRNRAPTQALRHRSDELGQAYFSMPEERKRLRYSPGVTRRTRVKARARTSALPKPQQSAISSMLCVVRSRSRRAVSIRAVRCSAIQTRNSRRGFRSIDCFPSDRHGEFPSRGLS